MGAPYNDLFSKLEAAMKSVVDALGLDGVTVNTGMDDDELTVPYVVCNADSAGEEVVKDTGLMEVSARVIVASEADAHDMTTHRSRVATVFDAFMDDAIAATLSSAVADFHCMDINIAGMDSDAEGRKHRNILMIDAVCCGSDLT